MPSDYPSTIHISDEMAAKINQPVDAAVISSRPGGGNTVQSFLKGDIIADALNNVFGPLGWGVEASIHQMDDWTETKSLTRNNSRTDVTMHMVQVVSAVKLTVKKTTADGTDTVFVQPGIGYGEAEEGKSRKEAFGMAVKGAATDGLKRCATLLGKAFGMMMASNGSQEDIEYAHNGKAQNLSKARSLRQNAQRGGNGGQRQVEDQRARGGGQRQVEDQRGGGQRQVEDQRGDRGDQQRRPEARDDVREQPRREEREPARQEQRPSERENDTDRRPEQRAERQPDARPADQRQQPVREPEAAAPAAERQAAPAEADPGAAKPARRQADTSYPLDNLPITKQDMTDFGATLVARVKEMRQHSDRVGLVKQHLNTVKNLDSSVRKRVIERLRELEVDVDKIPS